MPLLYVDNYRGFDDTIIPLKNVNFLVGENSTGKTSIMSLANLFFSGSFLEDTDFNNNEINLGSFKDIANLDVKNYFKIGIMDDNQSEKSPRLNYLVKFGNKNGMPVISYFSYIENNKIVKVVIDNKRSIRYGFKNIDNVFGDLQIGTLEFFKKWIEIIDSKIGQKYNELDSSEITGNMLNSIVFMRALVEIDISEKYPDDKNDSLPLSGLFGYPKTIKWIAPIRAKPKRTYDGVSASYSPEGEHTPYKLRKLLNSKKKDEKSKLLDLIERFGLESGLFKTIDIKELGDDPVSPFEIDIKMGNQAYKIKNVGYGVSQVLPILIELINEKGDNWIAIQQPEVHLHPRAQAALGELIHELVNENNHQLLIETHSDYLIDRFRYNIKQNKNNKKQNVDAQVLFFERNDPKNIVHPIEINYDGTYSEDQPNSFKEFFINEDLRLLEI